MSFPVFNDIDKSINEIFDDDFDVKCGLKVKTAGPWGSTVTSNTTLNCKDHSTSTKLSVKYPHSSGFTVEKFEIAQDGHINTETSLTGAAPNLKLEFKGNDEKSKGDVIATYKIPKVTLVAELDILGFSKLKASATSGQGAVTVGASVVANLAKSSLDTVDVSVGYTAPKFYGVVKAADTFKAFSGSASYNVSDKLTVAAKGSHSAKGVGGAAAAIYACCPNNTMKFKAGTCGALTASVKRSYEKKFTVVAAVSTNANNVSDFKWGVTSTLG